MAILTLKEAHQHLKENMPIGIPGRKAVLTLTEWASERNISIGNPLIAYLREGSNVGYTTEEYRNKSLKNNFLVIKLPDTTFHNVKDFQLDIFLGKDLTTHQKELVEKHPGLKSRWLIYGSKLASATLNDLKAVFSSALNTRFGIKL